MLNQVIVVGKVEMVTKDEQVTEILLEVKNPNSDDSELIPIKIGKALKHAMEYLSEGSTVGVKARLKNSDNQINVIAEKLTFINTKKDE